MPNNAVNTDHFSFALLTTNAPVTVGVITSNGEFIMASKIYGKLLPDYRDLDNKTSGAPGYRAFVLENDGGVSLQMIHANDHPLTSPGYSVFLNVDEAKELLSGLQEAIDRAEPKNASHPNRSSDC